MPTTSNVLQFFTEDGTKISVRPSGTEPLIRVMAEGPDQGQLESLCQIIADVVVKEQGGHIRK